MRLGITRRGLTLAAVTAGAGASFAQTPITPAAPLIYYGGAPGRLTMDRDDRGGNPLASALIDVLGSTPITLAEFGPSLAAATSRHAGGWQLMETPRKLADPNWTLTSDPNQARVALVLINSDYLSKGVASLPGARRDAKRLPAALSAAGFRTTLVLDAEDDAVRAALLAFSAASASADAAIIFLGGHGVQHRRVVYWMMRDYPDRDSKWLSTHALSLSEIGRGAQARNANLILYGGCRDDPFNQDGSTE